MKNHYEHSWELYKLYHEEFNLDFEYYLDFCKNHITLELFSGFGRLTNFLLKNNIDIESVELEPNFAKFIKLPKTKNHVCNVLAFNTTKKFDRIIAGVNSFCLLTKPDEINLFFNKLHTWLSNKGIASLSYYHPDFWHVGTDDKIYFDYHEKQVEYTTTFDFTERANKIAVWIDDYLYDNQIFTFQYPTRIYETENCLLPFLEENNLKLITVIADYHKNDLPYPGWREFVITKK